MQNEYDVHLMPNGSELIQGVVYLKNLGDKGIQYSIKKTHEEPIVTSTMNAAELAAVGITVPIPEYSLIKQLKPKIAGIINATLKQHRSLSNQRVHSFFDPSSSSNSVMRSSNSTSPIDRTYQFNLDEAGVPKAVLNDNTLKDETEEKKQKRQALDVINMISEVLAHGTFVKIKTTDPILATIATKYINYLTTSFNFKITFNLSDLEVDNHEGAINIFNELKMGFPTKKELEQVAWYQKALRFQTLDKKNENITGI